MSRSFFFFFFLLKPQKSLRKTRQCYTIPPCSLSYWTPARCECELSTRQHLFSEPLCPFSVLHVVRPLNPKKKMKRLRFLCFGFAMMIYSLIWNAAEGQSAGCYCFCSLSLPPFFLKLPPCRKTFGRSVSYYVSRVMRTWLSTLHEFSNFYCNSK